MRRLFDFATSIPRGENPMRLGRFLLLTVVFLLASASSSFAQSAIAGVVKDATGAVLPGVTIEARSPVLIEQMRSVTTDDNGQYKIVDLRPGVYSVTFTLAGFSAVKREGIEVPTAFTATLNVELKVGAVEESVTVAKQSPLNSNATTGEVETVVPSLGRPSAILDGRLLRLGVQIRF